MFPLGPAFLLGSFLVHLNKESNMPNWTSKDVLIKPQFSSQG